jgi:hypothetical protein
VVGVRLTTKCPDSRSSTWHLNPGPLEYKGWVALTKLQGSPFGTCVLCVKLRCYWKYQVIHFCS